MRAAETSQQGPRVADAVQELRKFEQRVETQIYDAEVLVCPTYAKRIREILQ